jgi:hypothetical protein
MATRTTVMSRSRFAMRDRIVPKAVFDVWLPFTGLSTTPVHVMDGDAQNLHNSRQVWTPYSGG